jgi:hypothetical protein
MAFIDSQYAADLDVSQYASDLQLSHYAADISLRQYAADIEIIGASASYYWMTFEDGDIILYEDGTVMEFEVD